MGNFLVLLRAGGGAGLVVSFGSSLIGLLRAIISFDIIITADPVKLLLLIFSRKNFTSSSSSS